MADEAVIIELLGHAGEVVQYTVNDGAAIEKGTIMYISADPRTAFNSLAATTGAAFAGIAATEKVASDGSTSLGLYTYGVFDLKCASGGCTLGALVTLSGANLIRNAVAADIIAGGIIGKALETGSAAETVAVLVGG